MAKLLTPSESPSPIFPDNVIAPDPDDELIAIDDNLLVAPISPEIVVVPDPEIISRSSLLPPSVSITPPIETLPPLPLPVSMIVVPSLVK